MIMNTNSYKISIEELEAIRDSINERIQQLREDSGADLTETFEEKIDDSVKGLEQLIDDRIENDDVRTLWNIAVDIRRLEAKIFDTLRFMD